MSSRAVIKFQKHSRDAMLELKVCFFSVTVREGSILVSYAVSPFSHLIK